MAEVLAMVAFMEWQQRLNGGHWLEREWLGDKAKVVVDHGAIEDRNKVPSGRAEPHSQHGSRILGFYQAADHRAWVAIIESESWHIHLFWFR
jgi:hypothetical protein